MLMRLRLILQAIQAIKLLEFLNPIRLILKLRLIVILTILARLKPLLIRLIRWPILLKHLIRLKLFMWPIMIMGRISSFTLSLQHHKFS